MQWARQWCTRWQWESPDSGGHWGTGEKEGTQKRGGSGRHLGEARRTLGRKQRWALGREARWAPGRE